MYKLIVISLVITLFAACQSSGGKNVSIEDLPFEAAKSPKEYADIVLKAIRTNREGPLSKEFGPKTAVNLVKLNRLVGMYSTAIGGRDWDFHDFYALSDGQLDDTQGLDYAWLDKKGRLGMQIFIKPMKVGERFYIESLDFRSRLDVIDSVSFPSGEDIDDYKKIDFDWSKYDYKELKDQ